MVKNACEGAGTEIPMGRRLYAATISGSIGFFLIFMPMTFAVVYRLHMTGYSAQDVVYDIQTFPRMVLGVSFLVFAVLFTAVLSAGKCCTRQWVGAVLHCCVGAIVFAVIFNTILPVGLIDTTKRICVAFAGSVVSTVVVKVFARGAKTQG